MPTKKTINIIVAIALMSTGSMLLPTINAVPTIDYTYLLQAQCPQKKRSVGQVIRDNKVVASLVGAIGTLVTTFVIYKWLDEPKGGGQKSGLVHKNIRTSKTDNSHGLTSSNSTFVGSQSAGDKRGEEQEPKVKIETKVPNVQQKSAKDKVSPKEKGAVQGSTSEQNIVRIRPKQAKKVEPKGYEEAKKAYEDLDKNDSIAGIARAEGFKGWPNKLDVFAEVGKTQAAKVSKNQALTSNSTQEEAEKQRQELLKEQFTTTIEKYEAGVLTKVRGGIKKLADNINKYRFDNRLRDGNSGKRARGRQKALSSKKKARNGKKAHKENKPNPFKMNNIHNKNIDTLMNELDDMIPASIEKINDGFAHAKKIKPTFDPAIDIAYSNDEGRKKVTFSAALGCVENEKKIKKYHRLRTASVIIEKLSKIK